MKIILNLFYLQLFILLFINYIVIYIDMIDSSKFIYTYMDNYIPRFNRIPPLFLYVCL